jgi:hypothetical protein
MNNEFERILNEVVFAFARRDFGKSQKISVRIASFWAKT